MPKPARSMQAEVEYLRCLLLDRDLAGERLALSVQALVHPPTQDSVETCKLFADQWLWLHEAIGKERQCRDPHLPRPQ